MVLCGVKVFGLFKFRMVMPLKTCIPPLLRVLVVLGFGSIFCVIENSRNKWDYLVFTQEWPETACLMINKTHGTGKCVIPKEVKGWTIHGLWPSVWSGRDPSYCNDSWPFRPDQIKDMWKTLEVHWPNLIADEATSSLWKHEWLKHGTCGVSLPSLQSEHAYFKTSLDLQIQYSLDNVMKSAGIIPSNDVTYKLDDIRKPVESALGHPAMFQCLNLDKNVQLLAQIEICLDKEFATIDCKESTSAHPRNRVHRRHKRPVSLNPMWDWYPNLLEFEKCMENVPVKYPLIL